jgi:NADP-dependent 3-hydroxy acid dehydrogenase YdfG
MSKAADKVVVITGAAGGMGCGFFSTSLRRVPR